MKRIKQIAVYSFCTLLSCVFFSCEQTPTYPRYTATTKEVIPDSLKNDHRTWITETVRAASQNMTGGDYEDVDETIIQAERTADRIFGKKLRALRIEISDHYWDDLIKTENELNEYEKIKFDSLYNAR